MVCAVLERYRIEEGISQKELAQRLNVTQAAISSWERGIRVPTPVSMKRIKELTGCDTDELMVKTASRKAGA